MYQKNILVPDLKRLESTILKLKKFFGGSKYKEGIIEIYISNISEQDLKTALEMLKSNFPQFTVLGMSSSQQIFLQDSPSSIALSFTVMENSKTQLFYKKLDEDRDDIVKQASSYAKELKKKIKSVDNVKAIEIYFAGIKFSASDFIEDLSKDLEDIPIFGAVATFNKLPDLSDFSSIGSDDSIIIGGTEYSKGITCAIFYGDDLHVYMDYLFGWEPIGRYMDVCVNQTSDRGITIVSSIDGQKPLDLYKKYLGLEQSENFVQNISEFPLTVERNGVYIGRMPAFYGESGDIFFEGDIHPDEKVRFSYGETDKILNDTRNGAARMDSFGAERLSLIICGNRFNFLRDDYRQEIFYYSEGRIEYPNLILGIGEIYKYKGKGGVLNSALVAVGMREGLSDETFVPIIKETPLRQNKGVIPLAERLAYFLKAMTTELVEAVEEANLANEAKSNFLSNMSHEIRTPINAILGMDEMILREANQEHILEYAQNIHNAGNTLISLVNDVLDFSKIEAGKMDIIPVDYDISSVVNDLVNMIKPKADSKNLELKIDMDSSIPSVLNGDEIRLKQIITNLLVNAVKYTKKGYVKLTIKWEKVSDDYIDFIVSVKDTGIGIKKSDIARLFSPFQRVDEVKNRTVEGSGLGLSITKQLLDLMGSQLVVESRYNKGSNFYFIIRQKVIKWEPVGDYMESFTRAVLTREKYHEKFTAHDVRVLVVDDTPINITVFKGLLKKTQVIIDEALSGSSCLDKTRHKKYDMIFLDHRMPEMDGIETIQILRNEQDNPNKDTVVISLTANAVSGAREQYIEAGFNDYLTKPILPDKLETIMLQYLPKDKVQVNKVSSSRLEDDNIDLSFIDDIEGIILSLGIQNCGSKHNYLNAIKSYTDTAPDNLAAIERFWKSGNIADYTIKVHALKSSSRIIGAMDLSKLAERMEKAGDKKNTELIDKKTDSLLDMYKAIVTSLQEGLEKIAKEDDDKPLMDSEALKEALYTIKELSASFDYDSIVYIIDTINANKVPKESQTLIKDLTNAIKKADWDEITRVLGSI